MIVWQNDMVMVFDEHGQQMPEYQGRWDDMREGIEREKPADVVVERDDWQRVRR